MSHPTLPAEWEPQSAVLLAFPIRNGGWGDHLKAVSEDMCAAALCISAVTPVRLLVGDDDHFRRYADRLRAANISVIEVATNDAWARDFGPITVFNRGRPTLLDFRFNGWGNRYEYADNDAVNRKLGTDLLSGADYRRVDFVLEGGSIETDGAGTLLVTERCLLNPNRNPGLDRNDVETVLRRELGTDRILWLKKGELLGDDTDAHVDTLARFTDPGTITYVSCDRPEDPHYADLRALEAELRVLRTPAGRAYRLLPLPLPPAVHSTTDGHRLPAGYANFLISNGTLFLPEYFGGQGSDRTVADLLRHETPYSVVGVNCRSFVEQHGTIHCLSMPLPAPFGAAPTLPH